MAKLMISLNDDVIATDQSRKRQIWTLDQPSSDFLDDDINRGRGGPQSDSPSSDISG